MRFRYLLLHFLIVAGCIMSHQALNSAQTGDESRSDSRIELLTKVSELMADAAAESGTGTLSADALKKSAALILEASRSESDAARKKYLEALSTDLPQMNFASSNRLWMEMDVGGPDIIIQMDDKGHNRLTAVFMPLPEASGRVRRMVELVDKFSVRTFAQVKSAAVRPRVLPEFIVARLLAPKAWDWMSVIHPQMLPPGEAVYRVVLFENVIRSYFDGVLSPLADKIFSPQIRALVDFEGCFDHVVLHKISHLFGPVVVETAADKILMSRERLKEYYYAIEEVKADTAAVLHFSAMGGNQSAERRNAKRALTVYILQLVAKLSGNLKGREAHPFLLQFNHLIINEGIAYNLEKSEIVIDFAEAKRSVEHLLNSVIKIEASGSHSAAKKLVKEYTVQTNILKRVKKLLDPESPALPQPESESAADTGKN
jgi:hypothetical protein